MMKLRLSLKNLAKTALSLFAALCLISGCSSSIAPTYLKEGIANAIQDLCKNEYKIEVKTKLVGQTLWIYLPVEDVIIMAEAKDKPEKYLERFNIEYNKNEFLEGLLTLKY